MKPICTAFFALALITFTGSAQANPEVPGIISQTFGQAVADNVLLLKGSGTTSEPVEWVAYTRDAFRQEEILRINLKYEGTNWKASPDGAGSKVLSPVPARILDFSKLRTRSAEARVVATKAAALAQANFVSVDYQLAANTQTGAPEWGLALKDASGYEVGFCVVSGETGALIFQDWTPLTPPNGTAKASGGGERAAQSVKRTARKAWNWTDKARIETKSFFRELFR